MKKMIYGTLVMAFFMSFLTAGPAFADKKSDIMDLLNKANAYVQANGVKKAVEAFGTDEFKDGELYLFMYDYDANCIVNGMKPKMNGKNFSKLKTPEGEYHLQILIGKAKSGGDWHEYRWMHPKEKKLMGKVSYIMPVDGMDAFIGSGYWNR